MHASHLIALALPTMLVNTAAFAQCDAEPVATPNPSGAINVFTDAEGGPTALHALLIDDPSFSVGNPVVPHVLRRDGSSWTDLGGPSLGVLEEAPIYGTIHVDADGGVWLGGVSAGSGANQAPPVIARYDDGWFAPQAIDLVNQVIYPFYERGGTVRAIDVAPDGTRFAVGLAKGYGLTDDDSIPLFLVDAGSGWTEVTSPSTDWPGGLSTDTFLDDVIAFAADDVWAVGRHAAADGGHPIGGLIVHWNGSSLSIVAGPDDGGAFLGHSFAAMAARSPHDIWAVGGNPYAATTSTIAHFDGTTWSRIESPVAAPLVDVALADDGSAWAAAGGFGAAHAHFDGVRWSAVDAIAPGGLITAATTDPAGTTWMLGQTTEARSLALAIDCACAGDVDGSGTVDVADLVAVIQSWGPCPTTCPADLDGNDTVGVADLVGVITAWGACPG